MQEAFEYSFPKQPGLTNPGVGTYRIVNYTLYLDYSDGRKMRHSFVVAGQSPTTPSDIWIRGYSFHSLNKNGAGLQDVVPSESDGTSARGANEIQRYTSWIWHNLLEW
jgi:hypothetical protein